MAGLQTIINASSGITINRRKVVGVQITSNQIPRTSLTPTRVPWRFTIDMPASLPWWNNRALVEFLDNIDRYSPQVVNFSDTCLSWLFRYQGAMTSGMISGLTVSAFAGNQMTLSGLTAAGVTNGTVMFLANDLIQIGTNPYPFTAVNTVTATSSNTITFEVNRPNFLTSFSGQGITVGPACNFNVFCPNMPTYKLLPGAYYKYDGPSGSGTINNARIEFTDAFELYEFTGQA
jgi:hypothetical protein